MVYYSSMNKLLLALVGCFGLLMGCANEVTIEEPQESPSGGNSSSSSSTSGGPTTVCVPSPDAPQSFPATCDDLDRLILIDPKISNDTDGDGLVEAGETASLTVTMKDTSGFGFYWYPGVEFATKDPIASVQADTWYYGILECGEQPATASIKVAPDAAPGTMMTIRAQIAMLNEKCPDAFAIDVPVKLH